MNRLRQSIPVLYHATLLIALGFMAALLIMPQLSGASANAAPPQLIGSDLLNEQERVFTEIYNTVAPSVVAITVGQQNPTTEDEQIVPVSTGSGFVIDTLGHIVTNYHVVQGADRIAVSFFDGTITRARVVGQDPDSDIAVIRVDVPAANLRPVTFANSDQLQVGQVAVAIGNPFQRDWTLTTGIISGLNRSIVGLGGFSIGAVIQTDAAINPGNSGGPLLNLRGEVIGVNSQIESGTRANSGVGFAVPSNLVNRVATQLISTGRMEYSFIGIGSLTISLDIIEQFSLPNNLRGVAVRQVLPNTPAANAGLQSPSQTSIDVITAINGVTFDSFEEMIGYLAIYTSPGQQVTLTVYRDGQLLSLPMTLIARSSQR